MKFENDQVLDNMAHAFREGKKSIINFRKIFFPAPDECAPAPFHIEWDEILRGGKQNFIVEAFRESGKSQIVIRGHTIYRLVYPSIDYDYIVIVMANQTLAESKLKQITDEYLTDPVLSSNLIKIKQQSAKTLDVIVEDVYGNPVNVVIQAYGKGSSIRGLVHKDRRPKLLVIDDPQDLDDSQSDTVMEKDWQWFLSDVKFLGQHTRVFMIGNNLGEKCLVERVIADKDNLGFDVMRIPVLDDDGNSAWPSKYTIDFIESERQSYSNMGRLDVWYRERMCIALSPDQQRFKREMFKYYDPKDIKKEDLSIYTTIDLASSTKSTADYRVILTVGVNSDNHWFVLDCLYGRYDPEEMVNKVFETVSKWRPLSVGIEQEKLKNVLEFYLNREMPKRNIFFTIKALKAERKKELRIDAMQPRFATGTVWFPEGADFLIELEAELLAFTPQGTKGKHDDLIDCLAYMEQIGVPPSGGWSKYSTDDLPYYGAI